MKVIYYAFTRYVTYGIILMDITFRNRKMLRTFNSESLLIREYGSENGKIIRLRLAFLQAAENLSKVPFSKPFRLHELIGKRKGQFAVDVKHPFRLIFIPNHEPIPRKDDNGIDLERVTAIEIINVEDYH